MRTSPLLSGSIEQLLIGLLVSLSHGLIIGIVGPYKAASDDQFAKACSFSLTALFAFSLILKVHPPQPRPCASGLVRLPYRAATHPLSHSLDAVWRADRGCRQLAIRPATRLAEL